MKKNFDPKKEREEIKAELKRQLRNKESARISLRSVKKAEGSTPLYKRQIEDVEDLFADMEYHS